MHQCSQSCSSFHLPIVHGENFHVRHDAETFQPNSFIFGMLIGTMDLYHFMLFLVALTFSRARRPADSETC